MIKLTNVFKAFPKGGLALKDVSFHIAKGEFAFLTGHSGAGKSTVLRLVYAEEPVTSGDVRVAEGEIEAPEPAGQQRATKLDDPALLGVYAGLGVDESHGGNMTGNC